jgi:O-antigen/teichoic acid export membrane protein
VNRPLSRFVGLLPQGTLRVAVGLAVLGIASYVHLAIAGHTLPVAQMADLSVLWSFVYSIGLGLFYPIEQEVTRTSATRRVAGVGARPVLRRGFLLAFVLCGAVWLVMAVTSPVLAARFFDGELSLVVVTALSIAAIAVYSPVRGVSAGMAHFDVYSRQLGWDGVLRIVLSVFLAAAGLRSAALFGLILAVAPFLATLAVARPVRQMSQPGPPSDSRELGRGVGPLLISMLLGQFALNSAVVGARLLAPAVSSLTAALLSALILIRIPVFIYSAIQASLLSGLAAAAAVGETQKLHRMVGHAAAVVTALMLAAGIPAIVAGPWLIHALFKAPPALSWVDFAILSAGTLAYLLALILGQAAISLHRHKEQMYAWVAGAVTLAVITALPGVVRLRVELAYACATWVVVAGLVATVFLIGRESPVVSSAPAQTG